MAERIGLGSCPVCSSPKARFTLSKKQLICVTCDACNVQVFARSDRSDQLLRTLIKHEAPAAEEVKNTLPPAPAAEDPPAADPASSSPGEPPAADPVPASPAAKPRRSSFMEWSR